MSQEPPNLQPPPSSESEGSQLETNVEQGFLKAQTIKTLRGTIGLLEGLVVKLEEPSEATKPTFLGKIQTGWGAALAKIRSALPENLSAKLSDTGLTGIIAGIAVILVWTTSVLLSEKPAEVAIVPPSESVSAPTSEPVPTPIITTPPDLTAPAEPQPVEVIPSPEPVPSPTPTVELTPEQNLIASIEDQVAEITDRYADGLIQSIQVDFEASRLTIKVGNDWYNLQQSQQEKLAARMLERSQELDFSRLEITDSQGMLLARSPVVGSNMVILKRQAFEQGSGVRS
ncbi:hypothetical protein [Chroococcidiopsis sp. CCMEE 29]|uniref:hypothetical protein n=1 Tax=Chroococcidiopsis sp. CCMEE 29 TaxID=155894 RepID=UPI0020209B5D|nr:hypothetical protein [Chroococcidiopsis sp. CCMEE 29]